jgi:hypothetical protein
LSNRLRQHSSWQWARAVQCFNGCISAHFVIQCISSCNGQISTQCWVSHAGTIGAIKAVECKGGAPRWRFARLHRSVTG